MSRSWFASLLSSDILILTMPVLQFSMDPFSNLPCFNSPGGRDFVVVAVRARTVGGILNETKVLKLVAARLRSDFLSTADFVN